MPRLWIKETHINETQGHQYYQGEWYEVRQESIGELFRDLQKQWGRAESKMHRDRVGMAPQQIGWVFGKTVEYAGDLPRANNRYHREVWVEVSLVEPKREMVWKTKPKSPWERKG